jgi:hypothetical protein
MSGLTYAELQAKWVEENDIKVGDKVRITRTYTRGENGFAYTPSKAASVGRVTEVLSVYALALSCICTRAGMLPYFAIEKYNETHRKFANAEEFEKYRGCWWKHRDKESVQQITSYCETGVRFGCTYVPFVEFCEAYTFADTGEPAGVKV